jgi:hypothetical protein
LRLGGDNGCESKQHCPKELLSKTMHRDGSPDFG